jgi:hypothetical protein
VRRPRAASRQRRLVWTWIGLTTATRVLRDRHFKVAVITGAVVLAALAQAGREGVAHGHQAPDRLGRPTHSGAAENGAGRARPERRPLTLHVAVTSCGGWSGRVTSGITDRICHRSGRSSEARCAPGYRAVRAAFCPCPRDWPARSSSARGDAGGVANGDGSNRRHKATRG